MKLNIDLGYILKRVIVIVLAFVIIHSLKGCEVFALNYNSIPRSIYTYEKASNTYTNQLNNLSTITSGAQTWYRVPKNRYRLRIQYNFVSDISQGYYDIIFNTFNEDRVVFNGYVLVGAIEYSCESYYDLYVSYPSYAEQGGDQQNLSSGSQTWICRNVAMANNVYMNIWLNGNVGSTSTHYVYFSQNINFVPNQNVESVIQQQTEQQHTDSENTQNAINGVDNSLNDSSIDSNTQNANGLFDTDENGQPTNPIFNSYGIESIITGPLRILQRSTESCSPVSFTIFSKQITLPCGDTLFWNRDFSSQQSIFTSGVSGSGLNSNRNTFRDLWNLLFGGAIIFHLLLKLYDVIQKAVDPMSDEYENINSAIDTSDKAPLMTGFEVVDMSNVQRNLNMRSIKKQSSNEAVVLGSLNKGV